MLLQGVMIRGLPTLVLYKDGSPLADHSGAITAEGLEVWLNDNLFSRTDEFEADARQLTTEIAKGMKSAKNDSAVEGTGGSKRGFVSFASQGPDDYMLSEQ